MGTRIFTEQLIRKYNPHLRYVRVHSSGRNKADIYAWNEELQLPAEDKKRLQTFAAGYLLPHVCFSVKEYATLRADHVPMREELPEQLMQAALKRRLDQHGIAEAINGLFPGGSIAYSNYEMSTGTIYFELQTQTPLTEIEKQLLEHYLQELIPLGTVCEVIYCAS